MYINSKFKPSLLAVLVTTYLASPALLAAPDTKADNGIVFENGSFGTNNLSTNIKVSADGASAVHVKSDATFKGNLNTKGNDVISTNGTGILIEGTFNQSNPSNPNLGVYIQGHSTVHGAENAIDFSKSNSSVRIDVEGIIEGNIIGNGMKGNKINFANNYGATKATFDGKKITGIGSINNLGELTIIGQDKTIFWGGDYTNNAKSSMVFKVGENSDLTNPILLVNGETTFKDNSLVTFTYTGSSINNILGQDIVLVESKGGISGGDKVTVASGNSISRAIGVPVVDSSPLLVAQNTWLEKKDPELNGGVNGDKLIVRYAVNYKGSDEFVRQVANGGGTQDEIATASYMVNYALDTHNKTGSAASAELLALMTSVGKDAQQSAELADEMTPDAEGSEVRAALLVVDKMRSQVDERTNNLRDQVALGSANNGWNAWVKGIYSQGSQSSSNSIKGYDIDTMGLHVGFDRMFNNKSLLGYSIGYADSGIKIDGSANTKDVQSMEFMIYGGWFEDNYFIDGNVNIGRNSNDTERVIGASSGYQGNTKANGEYDSTQIGYQLTAGKSFDLNYVQFEPRIAYNYQWIRTADYKESGSPASLIYDRQDYSVKQLGLGYRLYNTYTMTDGTFTPSLTFMYYNDLNSGELINEKASLVMDKSDHRFVIQGDEVGGDIIDVKFSAALETKSKTSIAADVNYYQRDDYKELILGLSAVRRF